MGIAVGKANDDDGGEGFCFRHEQMIDGDHSLLGVETQRLTLDNLGFAPPELARLREVLARPHGLVLLTGPTGSGKSTTLYAALRELATPELNVLTVEDPVEFVIPGIAQIQVDRAGKVTFAGALRACDAVGISHLAHRLGRKSRRCCQHP